MPTLPMSKPTPLKATRSVCPLCLLPIPAAVVRRDGVIVMEKSCPEHGRFEVALTDNDRYYHLSHGDRGKVCGEGCGCHAPPQAPLHALQSPIAVRDGHIPPTDPFETLSTCIALIELVDSCNLPCPTCYASSPLGVGDKLDYTPFDEFAERVEGVLRRKGFIDILQLSGGEPTLHPEFFRALEWAIQQPKIGYVLINTNAVRVAADAAFREQLGALRRTHGKFELYVQFDGPQEAGQVELRGGDFREARRKAIDLAGAGGVPTTLAMTVTHTTLPHLGDALRFGLERPHCRGITFQPAFHSGRRLDAQRSPGAPPRIISVGDIVRAVTTQSEGILSQEDFTPLPCGDPNCHTIGYLLRTPRGAVGLSRLVSLPDLQGFLRNRIDYRLEDLAQCGCESEPLGELIRRLELSPDQPFRIFIKPFMDAWTFDQDRIDRCCTHVIRRDGSLDSFCRYYLFGGAPGLTKMTCDGR